VSAVDNEARAIGDTVGVQAALLETRRITTAVTRPSCRAKSFARWQEVW
jgi:hypothetical protein